jgi:hypothetical protein
MLFRSPDVPLRQRLAKFLKDPPRLLRRICRQRPASIQSFDLRT